MRLYAGLLKDMFEWFSRLVRMMARALYRHDSKRLKAAIADFLITV